MANTFLRKTERNIGTSLTQIDSYAVGGSTKTTVIGLSVSNTTTSAVDIDATLNDGSNDFYIIKNCPVPCVLKPEVFVLKSAPKPQLSVVPCVTPYIPNSLLPAIVKTA